VTEDFSNNSSASQGRDGIYEEGQYWFSAFPDAKVSIEELLAEGDKVVVRLHSTATHQGEFFGAPPTGNAVEVNEIDIFRVENGLIAEAWAAPDIYGLLSQIGVLSAPE
jgi:predicted ester cyclase